MERAGGLEGTVERFTPQTVAVAMVEGTGLTPRAQHTATLLTDGRLLIAGGTTLSERAVESAEVFDFRSGHGVETDFRLHGGRQSHNARLLSDGSIYISAGVDPFGQSISYGEIFDPAGNLFRIAAAPPQAQGTLRLEASKG